MQHPSVDNSHFGNMNTESAQTVGRTPLQNPAPIFRLLSTEIQIISYTVYGRNIAFYEDAHA